MDKTNCPLCGAEVEVDSGVQYQVVCLAGCGFAGPYGDKPTDAEWKWDKLCRRLNPDPPEVLASKEARDAGRVLDVLGAPPGLTYPERILGLEVQLAGDEWVEWTEEEE